MHSYGGQALPWATRSLRCAGMAPVWVLFFLGAVDTGWAWFAGYAFTGFASSLAVIAIMAAISYLYGRTGRSMAIAEMAYYAALWIAFTTIGVVFTYAMATPRLPLLDEYFARFDAVIGFDWLRWHRSLAGSGFFNAVLGIAYSSLLAQIAVSVLYFSHIRQGERNAELWWNAVVSLALTGLVSALFPALGAFHHFHVDLPKAIHLPHLLALRDGSMTVFPLQEMQGIIAFPSYHTVMAILFTYAYRGKGAWFWLAALLNLLMLLSTPTFGGHYLVDMLSGALIAGLAIHLVRRARPTPA